MAGAATRTASTKAPRRRGRKGGAGGGSKDMSAITSASGNRSRGNSFSKNSGSQSTAVASGTEAYRPHKVPLITLTEETPTWYECGRNTPGRDESLLQATAQGGNSNGKIRRNTPALVNKYRSLGEKIYQHEVALAKQQGSGTNGRDEAWVESTMRRGTLKDRVAATSLVVSTHPVHKLYALDMLLNMVGINVDKYGNCSASTGRPNDRVAQMASEALNDLWTSTLLPPNRKLLGLDGRPLHPYESDSTKTLSPRVLLLWRYEEHLKARYSAYVDLYLGRTLSETTLDLNKTVALRTAANLLRMVPEGEASLLSMVANKIGDPSRKVASAAGHQLRLVLEEHPAMTKIVAREVQQLAHRPNLSSRALYNCIIFLNQLKLSKEEEIESESNAGDAGGGDDSEDEEMQLKKRRHQQKKTQSLPASLINTYFRLFEVAIKKSDIASKFDKGKGKNIGGGTQNDDGTMRGRLLSALLTGVNRAHPYLPRHDAAMEEHIDALYRISHTSPPAACTQALMLLYNLAIGTPEVGTSKEVKATSKSGNDSARKDRFYRALYSKLSDPAMLSGRQITLFFNLTYKAMKNDIESVRVVAFAKRLLHTAFHSSPSVVAASLFLTSEVMKHQPELDRSFETSFDGTFDPMKREPRAAFGDNNGDLGHKSSECSLWEVALASQHYHPTVQKFSSALGEIKYDGDPLRDFALAPFLDKLAYRNPKSRERIMKHLKRGESVAERRSGVQRNIGSQSSLPMNDPSLLGKGHAVAADEEFFHSFFAERAKRDNLKGITRGNADQSGNNDDDSDAEFEAIDASELKGAAASLEKGWDTDSSEEEFAQQLAEKLMESAGNGQANFDEEDPDMEGWSDVDDSFADDDSKEDVDVDYTALDGLHGAASDSEPSDDGFDDASDANDDADAFMDGDMSDSDANSDIGDAIDNDNGSNDAADSDDDGSDDDDGMLLEILGSDDESSNSEDERKSNERNSKGKRSSVTSFKKEAMIEGFADASDYAHLIGQGWDKRKRERSVSDEISDENEDSDDGGVKRSVDRSKKLYTPQTESKSQKRRKRRKQRN